MTLLNENGSGRTLSVLKKRLDHLDVVENLTNQDTPEFDHWSDTRLDRWIADWALRTGKTETAKCIAHNKNIEARISCL